VPDVRESAVEGLSLIDDDQPVVRVVLAGLPPIYRHGLAAGLSAAGMVCTPLATVSELPALLAGLAARAHHPIGEGACVVIVGANESAAVLSVVRDSTDVSVAAVHVVEEVTPEAYAEALQVGATGVVAMDAEFDQVVAVVRAAASGLTLLPRRVAKALCRTQAGPVPQLLTRERAWLRHLADSGTVGSLAAQSGYSEREMYRLLGGLYARLGAGNRTEALLLAERWGLLQEEDR
jgi:DNA-binding NarL/FixJ family response regulator